MIKGRQKPGREHKNGVSTGYETDGTSFWLAPTHVDRWGEIQDQERALDRIVETTIETVTNVRIQVEAMRRKWWDRVYADLSLDKNVLYTFNRIEGRLFPVKPEKQEEKGND